MILIVICSKSPNPFLYSCIEKLYTYQIQPNPDQYTVCIIDSGSDNFEHYQRVYHDFPQVHIHFIRNKNYEYGAWKYALSIYPDYEYYFCIQDSIELLQEIDIQSIRKNRTYTFIDYSGYESDPTIKQKGWEYLKSCNIHIDSSLHDSQFAIACHCSFIVHRNIMNDFFRVFTIPPTDKEGSRCFERLFGLYFIIHNLQTIPLNSFVKKIHGERF
jgi:hypothetical protein